MSILLVMGTIISIVSAIVAGIAGDMGWSIVFGVLAVVFLVFDIISIRDYVRN